MATPKHIDLRLTPEEFSKLYELLHGQCTDRDLANVYEKMQQLKLRIDAAANIGQRS